MKRQLLNASRKAGYTLTGMCLYSTFLGIPTAIVFKAYNLNDVAAHPHFNAWWIALSIICIPYYFKMCHELGEKIWTKIIPSFFSE